MEMDEMENGNRKLKWKAEMEKLKLGNGRQNCYLLHMRAISPMLRVLRTLYYQRMTDY